MPQSYPILNSFNGGELSPRMYGRTDLNKYYSGAKTIQNFHILPQGGVLRRSGFRYVSDAYDSTVKSRLIPFSFSTTQSYILEFSDQRIRVFANEGAVASPVQTFVDGDVSVTPEDEIEIEKHGYYADQGPVRLTSSGTLPAGLNTNTDYYIKTPPSIALTNSSFDTGTDIITSAAHGLTDDMGPFRFVTNGEIPTGADTQTDYFIITTTTNTFQLSTAKGGGAVNFTGTGTDGTHTLTPDADYARDKIRLSLTQGGDAEDITAAASGGTHTITPTPSVPIEIASPYLEADLFEIDFEQSADVLYLAHESHRPMKLQRFGATDFRLDAINFLDGPYAVKPTSLNEETISNGSTTGQVTFTASFDAFHPGDATSGRAIRLDGGLRAGFANIVEYVSPTEVIAVVGTNRGTTILPAAGPSIFWRLGLFSDNPAVGHPSAVTFHEQRLWWGGTPGEPQQFVASKSSDFETMQPTDYDDDLTVQDDYALSYVISSGQVNRIRWMKGLSSLLIGTVGGIHVIEPSTRGEAITPTNINARRTTNRGTASIQPVVSGSRVVYVTQFGRESVSIGYVFESDDFIPKDESLLADHLLKPDVVDMDIQPQPNSVLWHVRSDGVAPALTLIEDQEVFGWGRHVVGGSFGSGDAVIESVAVIPDPGNTHDQVWFSVKRTVNGNTVRYIEFMEQDFEPGDALEDAFFVDSGRTFTGPVSSITIPHLEGETITILADGEVLPDRVVGAAGVTALGGTYTKIHAGLPYTSDLETLRLEVRDGRIGGTQQGRKSRIVKVVVRLDNSLGGQIGPDVAQLEPIIYRDATDLMDTTPPLLTGDIEVNFTGGYNRLGIMLIRQEQPLPLTVLSLMPQAEVTR